PSLYEVYYLEVKGVTLEESGHCRFPDAPTERGARHILELIEAKRQGFGSGILFLIQLDNVKTFSPNDITDPEFGSALRLAKENNVDIMAYNCKVEKDGIEINKKVDIIL
ncbi:MAG: DNA/RNA nuclease SfsA, partial [Clostridium sp.]|nr:DNA/RNA nuclease SfsA [Clostridium sp.]